MARVAAEGRRVDDHYGFGLTYNTTSSPPLGTNRIAALQGVPQRGGIAGAWRGRQRAWHSRTAIHAAAGAGAVRLQGLMRVRRRGSAGRELGVVSRGRHSASSPTYQIARDS
jgi:hypothetical protein